MQVRLPEHGERFATRRHDRVRPGQERDALILDHPEQGLAPRVVAVDRHVTPRAQRHRDPQEHEGRQ